MEFSRQECWSALPFPSPRDLSDVGIEPRSPALQADSLPSEPLGKPFWFEQNYLFRYHKKKSLLQKDTSLVAQMVKHLPTMWETQVQSLGQEDILKTEMETHSSILAWKIPWTEEPGRLQSMGSQRVGHNWVTSLSFFLSKIWITLVLWLRRLWYRMHRARVEW